MEHQKESESIFSPIFSIQYWDVNSKYFWKNVNLEFYLNLWAWKWSKIYFIWLKKKIVVFFTISHRWTRPLCTKNSVPVLWEFYSRFGFVIFFQNKKVDKINCITPKLQHGATAIKDLKPLDFYWWCCRGVWALNTHRKSLQMINDSISGSDQLIKYFPGVIL